MAVDLIDATLRANRSNSKKSNWSNKHLPGSPLALYTEARYLIIRLPNSEFMKICYRLMIFLLALASIPIILRSPFFDKLYPPEPAVDQVNYESVNMDQLLTVLFRDLTNEGLMKPKPQQKAVFMNGQQQGGSRVVTDYEMEHVPLSDLEKQGAVVDNSVDFVFTTNFAAASEFIERALKVDGVVTVLLNDNPSAALYKPSNYKIAYMRRLDLIAVAMKKTEEEAVAEDGASLAAPRKLFGYSAEAKRAALRNLEDVLLEPPRAASGKSRQYLKRTRYLPDLMGDSLESYPRRVFIDVGLPEKEGGSGTDWFPKNYPTRNKNFEMYKIETVSGEPSGNNEIPQIGMSDWLNKNVKDEEYVVMKAEAEVVEEMMGSNSIRLVDELFLECKPHGKHGNNNGKSRSRRAYWECLALYGKLRDEGVAVHQWWG